MLQENKTNDAVIEEWKGQIAQGDLRAFRSLFEAYAKKLTRFSVAITHNRDASVEVLDEVFVKIWRNRAALLAVKNLTTYLYTAVKNTSLNYISRKAREQLTQPFDFINVQLADPETPDQRMITNEVFNKIKDAVEQLPPKCRMVFKLVREDGLRYKEVAEILNISENTVDAQMVIAVKKIGEKLKPYFDYYPSSPFSKKK